MKSSAPSFPTGFAIRTSGPKPVRLILFDIDGTLIATGGAGVKAFASVARTTFGRADGTRRISFAGRTDPSIVREFLAQSELPVTSENIARFLDDYVFWLDHHLALLPGRVLPGVRDILSLFRSGAEPPVMGLLTGNIRLGAELKLRHFDLWSEFVLGAFGDDHEDRNQLARIARQRGMEWLQDDLSGEEILVIGDTPLDIACANAIDARCLAVATGGYSVDELRRHGPEFAVGDLAEAMDWVRSIAPGA